MFSSLCLVALAAIQFPVYAAAEPAPTPTQIEAAELIKRATTSYYSVHTTPIPDDSYSIGVGKNGTFGNLYWLACIDRPLTVTSGFAGCGRDDVYTTCDGRVARGIDGSDVRCDLNCVTHKIFADLDISSYTPLIGCGRGTSVMNLVVTPTGSSTTLTTPGMSITGSSRSSRSASATAVTTSTSAASASLSVHSALLCALLAALMALLVVA